MNREMLTTREETFAPVVGLYEFDTEDQVIEWANDCDVGLGSFIQTENIARMWRVAEALEVGMVGVNLGCEYSFNSFPWDLGRSTRADVVGVSVECVRESVWGCEAEVSVACFRFIVLYHTFVIFSGIFRYPRKPP